MREQFAEDPGRSAPQSLDGSPEPQPEEPLIEPEHWARVADVLETSGDELMASLVKLTGNVGDAEDLLQDACQRAALALSRGSYKEEGKMLPWMIRIAQNRFIDNYRRRARHRRIFGLPGDPEVLLRDAADPEAEVEDEVTHADYETQLLAFCREVLDADQFDAWFAMRIQDLSAKDIAEQFGINLSTVRTRVHRAEQYLRASLRERPDLLVGFVFSQKDRERLLED